MDIKETEKDKKRYAEPIKDPVPRREPKPEPQTPAPEREKEPVK